MPEKKWQRCCVISFQKGFADLLELGKHRLNGQIIVEDPDVPQESREISVVSRGCKANVAGMVTISCPVRLVCCRSCMTGVSLPVSDRESPGSVPGQSIWDLWWKKWRWERFFLRVSRFSTVRIIKPSLHTHISVTSYLRYVILANDHAVKKYTSLSLCAAKRKRWVTSHSFLLLAVCLLFLGEGG